MKKQVQFDYPHSDYTIKWATSEWEINQAKQLRRNVFCLEQGVFDNDDQDDIDDYAQCLIAIANHGCWHDKVVGTVRIHDEGKDVWWGSRLAVDRQYRTHSGLGSALIKLAVGSANGLGCKTFLAQVQKQNETLFERLGWQSCYELEVRGRKHVMMQADLDKFPPNLDPISGFALQEDMQRYNQSVAPALLQTYCERLITPHVY